MRLYEAKMAPYPRRVKIYLAEKGIELERVEVDLHARENRSPAFLKKNPSGKIPVLELEGGAFLPESAAIMEYLEEIYPRPSMLGETPEQRAQTRATDRVASEIFTVLAQMLMQLDAPVQLRVLIPAVENSIDGNAYRPSDVLRSRKGLSVEIGNTDAEGRLVLADALAEADTERPDLLIDMATLTGAARVALGPELPAAFSTDENLLATLRIRGEEEADPIWPLPLWAGYDEELSSKIADLGNVSAAPFAGSIIGALFLKRFVTATPSWLHLDLYAWNAKDRPGRPVGAEAQCVRALYRLIRSRVD